MAVGQCHVCEEAKSKYKCPICLIPYCSLSCYKKHKEVPCSKSSPPEEKPIIPVLAPERPLQVDDQRWVVQKNQYESLANSSEIQDALKDGQLREIICKINSSASGNDELEKAMEGEAFKEFADKILSLIS